MSYDGFAAILVGLVTVAAFWGAADVGHRIFRVVFPKRRVRRSYPDFSPLDIDIDGWVSHHVKIDGLTEGQVEEAADEIKKRIMTEYQNREARNHRIS